jgi:hypothetical protein
MSTELNAAYSLLDDYNKSPELLKKRPDDIFIDNLLCQMNEYRNSDPHSIRSQSLALIFADAAERANSLPGKIGPNRLVGKLVEYNKEIILENAVELKTINALLDIFAAEHERGCMPPDPFRAILTGDEESPNTAEVLAVTTAYRVPVILLTSNNKNSRTLMRFKDNSALLEPTPVDLLFKMFINEMI